MKQKFKYTGDTPNHDMTQLMQLLTYIDNLEDFIKLGTFDFKINEQTAREILRLISEMKSRALQ